MSLLAAAAMTAGAAYAQAPAQTHDGVLADAKGMTLYTFDKDKAGSGTSACYDQCATNWPPFKAEAGAAVQGDWSTIMRTDGTSQWTYKGMPLYLFKNDAKPGDKKGDNVKDVWHVVKP
ncbi:hypothetical protein GSY71_15365 [Pusillimonas sp. TS35]|nr:hypothetical protein [Pusillimonas sp. TS35]